jgi:hypothetical protein
MDELSLYRGEQPAGAAGPLQHQLQHVQDSRGGAAQHAQRRLQSFCRKLALKLKGQCHEIFYFWFFMNQFFPKPLSIPLGPFRYFFSKIRGDIQGAPCTTGVVDTGGAP